MGREARRQVDAAASQGRVEDGRGSLGPVASTPFPIPAHRTGRADLRHPALRLASSLGPQQGTSEQAFHTEHAALTVDLFEGELPVSAPLHLMPSGEECAHALRDVVVDTAEDRPTRPLAEVV